MNDRDNDYDRIMTVIMTMITFMIMIIMIKNNFYIITIIKINVYGNGLLRRSARHSRLEEIGNTVIKKEMNVKIL